MLMFEKKVNSKAYQEFSLISKCVFRNTKYLKIKIIALNTLHYMIGLLASLFIGIVGYLMQKPFFKKNRSGNI